MFLSIPLTHLTGQAESFINHLCMKDVRADPTRDLFILLLYPPPSSQHSLGWLQGQQHLWALGYCLGLAKSVEEQPRQQPWLTEDHCVVARVGPSKLAPGPVQLRVSPQKRSSTPGEDPGDRARLALSFSGTRIPKEDSE